MSNLLKDASILLTPTAYENGRMNAIKPYKDLYGPELVTNGDFSNGSTGWTISGSASVGVNKLNVNAGAFDFFATQVALTNGLKCKVTIDAEVTSGDILLYTGTQFATISSSGSYTFYTTSDSSQIRFRSGGSGFVGSITNVSVKEDLSGDFQFSRNSAATRVNAQGLVENVQIISSELVSNGNFSQIGTEEVSNGNFSQEGSEQVTNGDFATDTKWTTNTGWTISGGSANCDGTQSGNTTLVQQGGIKGATINFVVGKTYKVNFDIVVTSGWISNIEVASGYDSNAITTSGNHTTYITAVSTNNRFTITANPDFIGSIDNVSVKEVGQDWNLGTGWSIGDDKVEADGTSAFLIQGEFQSVASVKSYKIQYEVISTNGVNIRFGGGSSMFGTPTLDTSTIGIKTIYLTSNGTVRNLQFQNNLGFIGSITNISVKEVGQDWTLSNGSISDKYNASMTAYQSGIKITPFVKTGKYKVVFDLVVTSGSCRFDVGGGNDEIYTTSGTKEKLITNPIKFEFNAFNLGWVGTLDNISVKEITDDTDLPRINYEGFSYQDSLGSEIIVGGDFSYDSGWNGQKTIANGQLTKNSSGLVYKSILDVSVKDYKVVVDVDTKGSALTIYLGGAQQSLSVGVNTIDMQSGGSNAFVGFNNGAGSIINSISVKEVVGQEVVPDSGCGSWLLEPQSTNLVTYSEDFSNSYWRKDKLTVTSNSTTSPSGDVNASLIQEISYTSAVPSFDLSSSISLNGSTYTCSFYVKPNNLIYLGISFGSSGERIRTNFDFNTETFKTPIFNGTTTGSVSFDTLGDYYRISITATFTSTTIADIAIIPLATDTYPFYAFQDSDNRSFYLWGFQLEQQSYATSYIPTNGATNTRLQDIANNSGNSTLINSTEGVLYAEIAALTNGGSNRQISISDGTNNNVVILRLDFSDTSITSFIRGNGGSYTIETISSITKTNNNKIALVWNATNLRIWVNGVESGSAAVNDLPIGLDTLSFNEAGGGGSFYGKNKALAVYKEALTDAQLQCLTTI